MIFTPTSLPGSYVIDLTPRNDHRGWFARTYCKKEFEQIGNTREFVQMNQSYTREKGALRGLHFQRTPHREIKVVRCLAGAVYDVIVDLRKDSPTFLQWFGVELSAQNKKTLYVPEGFAHGFQTLEENSELLYLVSEFYTPESEGGLRYNDRALKIQWPLPVGDLSEKDAAHPFLTDNFQGL